MPAFSASSVKGQATKVPTRPFRLQEDWEISLFVLNIAYDSQVAWMQVNPEVGSPKAILEAFFNAIIKVPSLSDYRAEVRYMDSDKEYWAVIREYRDRITKLSFTFVPPNVLNMRQVVADFTKLANEQGHPDIQRHTYLSAPGKMEPESPILSASAEIALEGGGDAEVVAGRKKVYSSSDARTIRNVDDEEMPTPAQPSFIRRVIDRLGL